MNVVLCDIWSHNSICEDCFPTSFDHNFHHDSVVSPQKHSSLTGRPTLAGAEKAPVAEKGNHPLHQVMIPKQ